MAQVTTMTEGQSINNGKGQDNDIGQSRNNGKDHNNDTGSRRSSFHLSCEVSFGMISKKLSRQF